MTQSPDKLSEFNATLDQLHKSELHLEKALSQYGELESIVRKNLKSKIVNTLPNYSSCSKIESKLSSSCKYSERSRSKNSRRTTPTSSKRSSSITEQRETLVENLPTKASIEDNSDQSVNLQVHKRIKQHHETVSNVNAICSRPVTEKTRFLKQLLKMNTSTWKAQKVKSQVVLKLENQLK